MEPPRSTPGTTLSSTGFKRFALEGVGPGFNVLHWRSRCYSMRKSLIRMSNGTISGVGPTYEFDSVLAGRTAFTACSEAN